MTGKFLTRLILSSQIQHNVQYPLTAFSSILDDLDMLFSFFCVFIPNERDTVCYTLL